VLKKNALDEKIPYLLILPSAAGFICFYFLPFLSSVYFSFVNNNFDRVFIGFTNYTALFQNTFFLMALKNTFVYMAVSIPVLVALTFAVSLLIFSIKSAAARAGVVFLLSVPLVIPSATLSFFWTNIFNANGWLNSMLFGYDANYVPVNHFNSDNAVWIMILIFFYKNFGYNIILFTAGLNALDDASFEAARVDGANALQITTRITIPLMKPVFIVTVLMSTINSFKVFKEMYMIYGNYPDESVYNIQFFLNNMLNKLQFQDLTAASTVTTLAIGLAVTAILIQSYKGEGLGL
jgi:multiple sugar transport system permease protein